ncbi:MAG: alpha/beta hydrolase family protein, partial [Mariniblastus sp.]
MKTIVLLFALNLACLSIDAQETFIPYSAPAEVPKTATELWQDYDARKEPLDVQIIKEWKTEGVVTQYLTFKVGTFKGAEARIAAYYSYPDNGKRNAAFVWSHGGGQRAERGRGVYFAKQGFATVDINWLGRPMEEDISINTDWGKVDPSQGPRFYSKALRKGWKRNLLPDEYSIDPVPSPRNANWFLLTVTGRRAITFLEQQPEVDPNRIGFTGFSMGGMVTALTAIDERLKAVAPFVGGTGFKYVDFPGGIQGSSIKPHFQNLELYKNTIDASAYWPSVKCPVLFISSSNDFHSTFERIYQSMDLLQHQDWRVTTNIHQNHGPGPEQWA